METPTRPKRPVRPIRCRYVSVSGWPVAVNGRSWRKFLVLIDSLISLR